MQGENRSSGAAFDLEERTAVLESVLSSVNDFPELR